MSEPLLYETHGEIAEIILNRPEKKNALSLAMWKAIPGLVERAAGDSGVKVLLLASSHDAAFAAGADISEFEDNYRDAKAAAATSDIIGRAVDAVEACPKPVIAAIEGVCVGGGVSLAVAADLRVASENARFGITPGKLGILYSPADTRRLVRAVGVAGAKDLLFTGRIIHAEEARDLRLIDRLVPPGQAKETARSLAAEIGRLSQWSVRATKAMIDGLESGWSDDDRTGRELFLSGFSGKDFEEGFRAFLDKRKPDFPFR